MVNEQKLLDTVVEMLKTGNWGLAQQLEPNRGVEVLGSTVGSDGAVEVALSVLRLIIEKGYHERVHEALDRVLPFRPGETLRLYAKWLRQKGAWSEFIPLFERAESLVPREVLCEVVTDAAKGLLACGRKADSIQLLRRFGCFLQKREFEVWNTYAQADSLSVNGQRAEASRLLRTVIDTADREALAAIYQMLGENALREGNFSEAKTVYERMIAEFSSDADAKDIIVGASLGLAEALQELGSWRESEELIERVCADKDAPEWAVSYARKWLGKEP